MSIYVIDRLARQTTNLPWTLHIIETQSRPILSLFEHPSLSVT